MTDTTERSEIAAGRNSVTGPRVGAPKRANKWIKGLALALALGISATACGGGGDGDSGESAQIEDAFGVGVEDDEPTSNSAPAPTAPAAEAPDPETIGGLAGPLQPGQSYTTTVAGMGQATVVVPEASVLSMSIEGTAANANAVSMNLTSVDGHWGSLTVGPGGTETAERLHVTPAGGGTELAIELGGAAADEVTISFDITSQAEGEGEFADAGADTGVAAPLTSGEAISGLLGNDDQADNYSFEVADGGVIEVALAVPADESGTTWAELFYNGERRGSVSVAAGGADELRYVVADEESGDWFVEVTGGGAYELTTTAASQDDAGSGQDAGSELADAVKIEPGTYTGTLGDKDDEDLYVLDLEPGQQLTASLTIDPSGSGTSYLDPIFNGSSLGYITLSPGGTDTTTHVFSADESGQLSIEISGGDVAYTMEVSLGGQDDGGSGRDAGPDASTAVEVAANSTFEGRLGNDDVHDFYSFVAEESGVVSYTISQPAGGSRTGYLTPSTNGVDQSYATVGAGAEVAGEITVEAGETVVLDVESIDGPYTVVLGTGENSPQPDTDETNEVELNDTDESDDADESDAPDTEDGDTEDGVTDDAETEDGDTEDSDDADADDADTEDGDTDDE